MPHVVDADPTLVRSVLWYETRVLHHLTCEHGNWSEVRVQAARVLQAATAAELGNWDEALDALKGET